jgi:restriction endonuclease S subunit
MKFERLADKIIQVRGIAFNPKDISDSPLPDYVPVLKANNIKERGLDISNLIYIHRSKVKPEQFIKKGDLLLAASSGSKDIVGKNIFFENDFEGSFGAFCKLVRPNEKINHNFLGVFFKTPNFKRHIRKLIQGVLINNLKNEHIDSLQIPSLSFSDQIEVANILNKAETLIEQRKQSISLLDEYLKSTFLEMFGDPGTNPYKWNSGKLENSFLDKPLIGSMIPAIENGTIPIVRVGEIGKRDINLLKCKFSNLGSDDIKKYLLKDGDILLARAIGSESHLGKASIFIDKGLPVVYDSHVMRIRFNKGKIHPEFFFTFLQTKGGRSRFMRKAGQTAVQFNINSKQISDIDIPVPPIELQTQFANIVTKIEALKEQYKNSLQELENLYGSLSQRAFKGDLELKEDHSNHLIT